MLSDILSPRELILILLKQEELNELQWPGIRLIVVIFFLKRKCIQVINNL
jgi:hypothetical protein